MHSHLLFLNLGGSEILLIAVLALLFFGGKKIPELMNGLGRGMKSFRDGIEGKSNTDNDNPDANNDNRA